MLTILSLISSLVLSVQEQTVQIPPSRSQPALNAIMASPAASNPAKKPAVLIIIGSGEGSTDDSTRAFNPFQTLARKMAEAGFVTLRFDKRGTGYNKDTGEFRRQTLSDYDQDAADAYTYLKSREDVDPDRIYFAGHSIGTLVASHLAAKFNIKGLILIAGPEAKMLPVMEEQQRFYLSNTQGGQAVERILNFQMKPMRDLQAGTFDLKTCDAFQCQTEGDLQLLNGQTLTFWHELLMADQMENLSKLALTTPVLCIAGENDWVMDSKHSREACRLAGTMGLAATFIEVPKSDHFFSLADSKEQSLKLLTDRDFGKVQENPQFADSIVHWLSELGP